MAASSLLGVDWSDWVIRIPEGGGALGTVFAFLVVALVVFALLNGLKSISDRITGSVWSLVSLAAFIVFVLLVARFQDDDRPGRPVDHEITTDECPEELLSRCPPLDGETNRLYEHDPNKPHEGG